MSGKFVTNSVVRKAQRIKRQSDQLTQSSKWWTGFSRSALYVKIIWLISGGQSSKLNYKSKSGPELQAGLTVAAQPRQRREFLNFFPSAANGCRASAADISGSPDGQGRPHHTRPRS